MNSQNSLKGFTLVEFLVVFSILGILSTVLIGVIDPFSQIQKARDAQRKSDLAKIQSKLEEFYNDYGRYPRNSGGGTPVICSNPVEVGPCNEVAWGDPWPSYMQVLPKDPAQVGDDHHFSYYRSDQNTYFLMTLLENENDPTICPDDDSDGDADCTSAENAVGADYHCDVGDDCNWGLSSPNIEID